jgi:hypothetical protein
MEEPNSHNGKKNAMMARLCPMMGLGVIGVTSWSEGPPESHDVTKFFHNGTIENPGSHDGTKSDIMVPGI